MNNLALSFDYQSNGLIDFLISLVGLIASIASATYIAGKRQGRDTQRIKVLEQQYEHLATKDDILHISEKVAEIRGMFQLTLRQDK